MRRPGFRRAVVLEYSANKNLAPMVTVRDSGISADELVKIAKRFNVPIVERKDLARSLETVEVDSEIPEHLYEAIAIVINTLEQEKAP